jgi:hypothetical protein
MQLPPFVGSPIPLLLQTRTSETYKDGTFDQTQTQTHFVFASHETAAAAAVLAHQLYFWEAVVAHFLEVPEVALEAEESGEPDLLMEPGPSHLLLLLLLLLLL